MGRLAVGIVGSGNIGTDLMFKLLRSENMELRMVAGVDPASEGLALARKHGIETSTDGIEAILREEEIKLVFDATGARIHMAHAPLLKEAGKIAVDLTPAAVGPFVVPAVNMDEHLDEDNVNLISCSAQATIPIIAAVSRVTPVEYAEIATAVASRSVGPGTRQNIDEFTRTANRALMEVGGAQRAKTITANNPADPPMMMRNSIYVLVGEDVDEGAVEKSIMDMVKTVQTYVPGYQLKVEPYFDEGYVTTLVEVEGEGDYLPPYAGNLDIITAAAVAVGEKYALSMTAKVVG